MVSEGEEKKIMCMLGVFAGELSPENPADSF
jgi:hypothetical protein